jgi:hypothetical protein
MNRSECGRGEGSGGEEREGKETDGCPLTEALILRPCNSTRSYSLSSPTCIVIKSSTPKVIDFHFILLLSLQPFHFFFLSPFGLRRLLVRP